MNTSFWFMHADHYCPWKEHLQQLEAEYKVNPLIKYVLYSDTGSTWYTTSPTIFDTCWWIHITIGEYKRYRLHPIHSRTAYLFLNPGEACAMKRCRLWLASRAVSLFISFCHLSYCSFLIAYFSFTASSDASGFIGGHKTKEGVIQMAQKALELAK